MTKWDLSSETMIERFLAHVGTLRLSGKRPLVEFVPESRSLDQNSMSFALYKQVAEQKQDESVEDIRRRCKLEIGIPILRRDDEEFRWVYDNSVKLLPYEKKLLSMKWTDVTSRMSKKQFGEYLDEIIRDYSMQGYSLVHPSEDYSNVA